MVTALEDLTGATVLHKAWSANQAQVLEVQHDVAVDGTGVLPIGEAVTFTDVELGFQFEGKITDVRPNFGDGEGVRYICADNYRVLVKTPGYITAPNGKQSSKIKFVEGTLVKTALSALIDELPTGTLFPGGVDLSNIPDNPIPLTDKGGQFLDTWIDDLLENTSGGIVYVDPNNGSPKLLFRDYFAEPNLTLDIRDFIVAPTVPGANVDPLMEQADAGETLDRKYKSTVAEGCGEFTRREDIFIPALAVATSSVDDTVEYHFVFPEGRVTGRFLDADGKCREEISTRFRLGFESGQTAVFEIKNMPVETDANGKHFSKLFIRTIGLFGLPDPVIPVIESWWTYTSYDGPIIAKKTSADTKLNNEGEFWEDHPEFFKFTGATNVDLTAQLQAVADNLHKRYSEGTDINGSIRLHIRGINTAIKIGAKITNDEFKDARVQHISYDYVERSTILDVSTVPVRRTIQRKKQELQESTVEGGGWFQNREQENANCFCGGAIFTDEDGDPNNLRRGGGPEGQGGESFDCILGNCQRRADNLGQYQTLADCQRDCIVGGFDFVDCFGCLQVEHVGEFETFGDCETAHADILGGCEFICDDLNGCQPVPAGQGQYATRAACEAACEGGSETGSGDDGTSNSLGQSFPSSLTVPPTGRIEDCGGCGVGGPGEFAFVKQITVDAQGRVTDVQCDTCSLDCAASVAPQTFAFSGGRFIGASNELPVVTLITQIDTDSCGRITQILSQDFSVVPKWQ